MLRSNTPPSIDYLAVGHITRDTHPDGDQLGGTVTYAALTARMFGLKPAIITSWGEDFTLGPLSNIPIVNVGGTGTTTFQNVETSKGRKQSIIQVADQITEENIPSHWKSASIVHLGPVANEIDPGIIGSFSASLIGITPQGWMRQWDETGTVTRRKWKDADSILSEVGAAVISIEDIFGDEILIEELAEFCRVLAVTEGVNGVRLYWNGDVRRFVPPIVDVVDTTGAGDIFAASFFIRLYTTRDPWESARFATKLASFSISRAGMKAIPTAQEIQQCLVQVKSRIK